MLSDSSVVSGGTGSFLVSLLGCQEFFVVETTCMHDGVHNRLLTRIELFHELVRDFLLIERFASFKCVSLQVTEMAELFFILTDNLRI